MYARDKGLTMPIAVAEAATHYLQVHGGTLSGKRLQRHNNSNHDMEFTGTCYNCKDQGHKAKDCPSKPAAGKTEQNVQLRSVKSASGKQVPKASAGCVPHTLGKCVDCGQREAVTLACGETLPVIGAVHSTWSEDMPVVTGKLGAIVVQTLRDTGCTGVVVRQSLVSEQDITGTHYTCVLIDGTVRSSHWQESK